MLLWTLTPMALLLLLGWYLYVFAMRGLVLVIPNKKRARIVALIVSGAITLAAMIAWAFANVFVIVVLHLYAFLALVDLVSLIIRRICKREPKVWKIIYRTAVIPLAVTIALMTYGNVNIRNVHETEYTVTTNKNIRAEGYEIALLADIHYGLLNNSETLRSIAERIEEHGDRSRPLGTHAQRTDFPLRLIRQTVSGQRFELRLRTGRKYAGDRHLGRDGLGISHPHGGTVQIRLYHGQRKINTERSAPRWPSRGAFICCFIPRF